jgi:hypothetical protein
MLCKWNTPPWDYRETNDKIDIFVNLHNATIFSRIYLANIVAMCRDQTKWPFFLYMIILFQIQLYLRLLVFGFFSSFSIPNPEVIPPAFCS